MNPSHHLSLKLIQRCPACNAAFQQAHVTTLSESETTILAHLQCVRCQVNLVANVVVMPQGLVGNAILTDAEVGEINRFISDEHIHEDQFLKIYENIHSNLLINQIRESVSPEDHAVGEVDS